MLKYHDFCKENRLDPDDCYSVDFYENYLEGCKQGFLEATCKGFDEYEAFCKECDELKKSIDEEG